MPVASMWSGCSRRRSFILELPVHANDMKRLLVWVLRTHPILSYCVLESQEQKYTTSTTQTGQNGFYSLKTWGGLLSGFMPTLGETSIS
jgi:hypothetical protein